MSDDCSCGATYSDENEHFQIHLIQELAEINKQINQANIMTIESHNLLKDHIKVVRESSFINSFTMIMISLCIAGVIHIRSL